MPTKSSAKPHRKRPRRTHRAPRSKTTGRSASARSQSTHRNGGAKSSSPATHRVTPGASHPSAALIQKVRRLEARWRKLLPQLRAHARRRG